MIASLGGLGRHGSRGGDKPILPGSYRYDLETTRLSTKGQVILPKAIRDAHHWDVGTEFPVKDVAGGILLRPIQLFSPSKLGDVRGALHYTGRAKTLMKRAIAEEVRQRRGRGRY